MHVIASAFGTSTCTIAFDDKNFSGFDIVAGAIRKFLRKRTVAERAFALDQFARLSRCFARFCSKDCALTDQLCFAWIQVHPCGQFFIDRCADESFDLFVEEFFLRLIIELRIRQLDADHCCQTFAQIVAAWNKIFQNAFALGITIHHASQRRLEALDMSSTIRISDVVSEGEHVLGSCIGVLQGNVAFESALRITATNTNARTLHDFAFIEPLDIRGDSFSVPKCDIADRSIRADMFVDESNAYAWIEKCQFAQSRLEHLGTKLRVGKNLWIGKECHPSSRTSNSRFFDLMKTLDAYAALE